MLLVVWKELSAAQYLHDSTVRCGMTDNLLQAQAKLSHHSKHAFSQFRWLALAARCYM